MAKKAAKKKFASPVGEMVSGFIQKPSTKYSKDPNGEYSIVVRFTGDEPNFDKFKKFCDAQTKKAVEAMHDEDPSSEGYAVKALLQPEVDKSTKKPTGNWLFKAGQPASFKNGDFRQLSVFTPGLKPFPKSKLIGRGSKVSISFTLGNPYIFEAQELVGIKAWLQAVQIREFVEYTGPAGEDFGFEADEDGDEDLGFDGSWDEDPGDKGREDDGADGSDDSDIEDF